MVRKNIKMVHPSQIAAWKYQGCKTVQGVVSFCQKNKSSINCVWWKAENQRILMVDPQSFRQTWKEVAGTGTTKPKTQQKKTQYKKTQIRKVAKRPRATAKRRTYKTMQRRTARKAA